MNDIPTIQSSPECLEILAAQSSIHSQTKTMLAVQIFLSVPTAILVAVIAKLEPQFAIYAACYGIIIGLADVIFFEQKIVQLKKMAAQVQELFDTQVLGLHWNAIVCGEKPRPEIVVRYFHKHVRAKKNLDRFKAWYPEAVGGTSIEVGRLLCQRTNCVWGAELRRKYANILALALILLVISIVGSGIGAHYTVEALILTLILPLLPAFTFGFRQFKTHTQDSQRLDALTNTVETLINELKSGRRTLESIGSESRVIQDQIFLQRSEKGVIFDALYELNRKRIDEEVCIATKKIVAECSR